MLTQLDESENIPEDQKLIAKEVLLKKGSTEHLVMNLTGAGGCGKSFVLNASRSMCEQFCKLLENHLIHLYLLSLQLQTQQLLS